MSSENQKRTENVKFFCLVKKSKTGRKVSGTLYAAARYMERNFPGQTHISKTGWGNFFILLAFTRKAAVELEKWVVGELPRSSYWIIEPVPGKKRKLH